MRRGSDKDDCPILHIWKQDILLGLVEAVYLVHKENRPHAAQLGSCAFTDLSDLSDI